MAGRNIARVLAPLALVAAAVGIVIVIQASAPDRSEPNGSPSATERTTTQPKRPARRRAPRAYVVKAGDTLTVIAERTGVTLETIERLNPDVDPQALQTGQRLKLGP